MKEKKKDSPVVADPEIERVADALSLPEKPAKKPEPEPEPEPEESLALPPVFDETKIPKRKKAPKTSHKVTDFCGQLNRDGVKYLAGEGIDLSAEEAAALGKNVEPA